MPMILLEPANTIFYNSGKIKRRTISLMVNPSGRGPMVERLVGSYLVPLSALDTPSVLDDSRIAEGCS